MRKSTLLIIAFALIAFSFTSDNNGSDCNSYYPINKGMKWVNNHYNAKGKLQSSSVVEVLNETNTASGVEYTILSKSGPDEKDTTSLTFTYQCENGLLKIDMNQMLPQESLKSLSSSMEIEVNQYELEFPSDMSPGSKLKDANISIIAKSNGIKIMELKVKIFDRMVEKAESITTPAGTFECLKLNYKTTLSMGFMNRTSSSIDWISNSAGLVKTELYDKKGKLESYSELAEFSK